jgi:octaprenyl-diphosphate synthase
MSVLNLKMSKIASKTSNPLDDLQNMLASDMKFVNAMILDHMHSDVALIPHLASYLIAAGGKRIRPLLTLASTQLFKGDMIRAHRLAACVEFIHTATLLHDDVVDNSDERRGKKSANIIFGNEASVLVGDFLFSRAFQLMVVDGNLDILRILSNASAVIAEGEVLQLSVQNNIETSMTDYYAVIEGKTAALFAAACEVGPVIAEQNEQTIKAMRDYGLNLGIAFQIADDVLDYSAQREQLGKAVGDDFREGKMTAPVILAIEKSTPKEKEFWTRTLGKKDQKDGDLETAQALITKYDTLNEALKIAHQYGEKACSALETVIPDSPLRQILSDLVTFTFNRDH